MTLTSEGRSYVAERSAQRGDLFGRFADRPAGPDLRDSLHELHAAARQIASSGTAAQVEAAAQVLAQARRSLYLIWLGRPRTPVSDHYRRPFTAGRQVGAWVGPRWALDDQGQEQGRLKREV